MFTCFLESVRRREKLYSEHYNTENKYVTIICGEEVTFVRKGKKYKTSRGYATSVNARDTHRFHRENMSDGKNTVNNVSFMDSNGLRVQYQYFFRTGEY